MQAYKYKKENLYKYAKKNKLSLAVDVNWHKTKCNLYKYNIGFQMYILSIQYLRKVGKGYPEKTHSLGN